MAEQKVKHEVLVVKHRSNELNFKSKSEAFDHFFISYLNAGMDDVQAVEKASKVSAVIAKAKGLPDSNPDPIEKAVDAINKLAKATQQHPKLTELAFGFASGFIGGKVAERDDDPTDAIDTTKTEINLDEIE